MGYGTIKKMLLAAVLETVQPMRERYLAYLNHFDDVQDILDTGAKKARKMAAEVLARVKGTIFNMK
jgi:tryptophanyl-tRNA synthetase